MAIKGLTGDIRIPLLGHFRLGTEKADGPGRFSTELDYFRPDPIEPEIYLPKIEEIYETSQPRRLNICFPLEPTPEQWKAWFREEGDLPFYTQNYERWAGTNRLMCQGDGERATMTVERKEGKKLIIERQEVDCVPDECEFFATEKCRRVGRLDYIVYDLPGIGLWRTTTGSRWGVRYLNSTLKQVYTYTSRIFGSPQVAYIPLVLIRFPQEMNVPTADGNIIRKVHHLVKIDVDFSLQDMPKKLGGFRQLPQIEEAQRMKMIPHEPDYPADLFPHTEQPEETKSSKEQEAKAKSQTETDKEIEALFDELKYGKGKRDALQKSKKYAKNPEALLAKLREEAKAAKAKPSKEKKEEPKSQATFF